MEVLIYTSESCEPCSKAKADLDSIGISYTEESIANMPSEFGDATPITVFRNEDKVMKVMRGWSPFFSVSVRNVLDLAG